MRILNLYKAILLHLVHLAHPGSWDTVRFRDTSAEDLKFPESIFEKERDVMVYFDRSPFRTDLDQLVEALDFVSNQTDAESEGVTQETPASGTAPDEPSETRFYLFREELPPPPEARQIVQEHAYDWVNITTAYANFLHPQAPESHRELWVNSKPGTGKSTLLEAIAHDLDKRQELGPKAKETTQFGVAAFFCNRGKERAENPAAILQCLVFQVLHHQARLRQHFLAACKTSRRDRFERPEDLHIILPVFQAMVADEAFEPTCFVIDAIDECCSDEDEAETQRAVWTLMDVINNTRRFAGVRWLISSDSDSAMKRLAPRTGSLYKKLELSLDEVLGPPSPDALGPVLLRAAEEHVSFRVSVLMKEVQVTKSFLRDVEDKMLEQSKGNFLWVDLACKQILAHGLPWNAIHFVDAKRVPNEALPSGLEPLYEYMDNALSTLRWDSPRYCYEILNTLAAAYKPLRLCELGEFLLGNSPDAIPPSVDLTTIITKQCFAFLELREGELGDRCVFFVHQSAKNFFRKKMEASLAQRHTKMALCCLRVLSEQLSKASCIEHRKSTESRHYFTWYWVKHLSKFPNDNAADEVLVQVAGFLEKYFLQWLETLTQSPGLTTALTQMVELESVLLVCLLSLFSASALPVPPFGKLTRMVAPEPTREAQ